MKTTTTQKSTSESTMKSKITSFMSNVNKLDEFIHKRTHSKEFGTVRHHCPAWESANGKRKFVVSNSPVIRGGVYTFNGLREALIKACK